MGDQEAQPDPLFYAYDQTVREISDDQWTTPLPENHLKTEW